MQIKFQKPGVKKVAEAKVFKMRIGRFADSTVLELNTDQGTIQVSISKEEFRKLNGLDREGWQDVA